jgi:hypothetical protein
MLGVGIGLLAAGNLGDEKRRALGRTLFTIGALSTIPLLWQVLARRRHPEPETVPWDEFSGAL